MIHKHKQTIRKQSHKQTQKNIKTQIKHTDTKRNTKKLNFNTQRRPNKKTEKTIQTYKYTQTQQTHTM